MRTPPVPAAVPPVGASPPSSSSASGSPAECVCGRYALFHTQLRKSGSVDIRGSKTSHVHVPFDLRSYVFMQSTDLRERERETERRVAARWGSLPSRYNGSSQQIFPWQQ